jgi:hypothetical protein
MAEVDALLNRLAEELEEPRGSGPATPDDAG